MGTRASPRSLRDCERLAESILRGRVEAEPRQLLDVIHAVNPTGHGLDTAETQRRYALKSRLQSLLVRRFRDDLVIEPEADGIVGLRLRSVAGDACHARLCDLEDDARAWLRLQLDLGLATLPPPPAPAAPPARKKPGSRGRAQRSGSAAERLADADELLLAYDYAAAREALEDAFALTAGAPAAAVPLLSLLVDTLAADGDALSLEEELSAESAALPSVRALLAVAAARLGDSARAFGFLDGLTDPRSADAWLLLARAQPDPALASRHLRRAAQLAPTHPELASLESELSRREADLRRPAEEALGQAIQSGEDAAIEQRARDVLARWPASEAAGRALRELEVRRRDRRAQALLAEADAARDAGDFAAELRALRGISQAGSAVAGLESRLERAAADEEDARAARLAAELHRRRAAGERAEALLGFLELAPRGREKVRGLGWPELPALEALGARCRPREAVEALLALEEAERATPERTRSLLARHERAFAGLPRAREPRPRRRRGHPKPAPGRCDHAARAGAGRDERRPPGAGGAPAGRGRCAGPSRGSRRRALVAVGEARRPAPAGRGHPRIRRALRKARSSSVRARSPGAPWRRRPPRPWTSGATGLGRLTRSFATSGGCSTSRCLAAGPLRRTRCSPITQAPSLPPGSLPTASAWRS
ncbi:MAG: hypothetical protein QM765_05670 [Myxococcales bacterium]